MVARHIDYLRSRVAYQTTIGFRNVGPAVFVWHPFEDKKKNRTVLQGGAIFKVENRTYYYRFDLAKSKVNEGHLVIDGGAARRVLLSDEAKGLVEKIYDRRRL